MRILLIYGFILGISTANTALSENKKDTVQINKEKKEATVNISKDSTWKAGATEPPKKPESNMSEKDKREQQNNKGGQIFIRKTF